MRRTVSIVKIETSRHWREFIELLSRHHVRFIVVGAHALAVLGRPRNTGDLDVFVDASPTNVKKLGAALREFGFVGAADAAQQFEVQGRMMTLGVEPNRIDISNDLSDLTFEEAWAGRLSKKIGEHTVAFLGRTEYIKNKIAASKNPHRRAKDLADIAMLEAVPKVKRAKLRRRPR
jgi:hypothetical protein